MRLKSLHFYIIIVYALLNLNKSAFGQCATGSPQTIADSVAYSPGTMDENYYLSQFDPSLGTLIGVKFDLTTSGYTILQLVNGDGFVNTFSQIKFQRTDQVVVPGIGSVQVHDSTINYPDATVLASNNPSILPPYYPNLPTPTNVWQGSAFTPPSGSSYSVSIPASAFSGYTGIGMVGINYKIVNAFSHLSTGGHVGSYVVTMATNLKMKITYTYCNNSILPIGRLEFAAKTMEGDKIALSWTKENEDNNITYGVEMSTNGVNFTAVGSMQSQKPANSTTIVKYEFDYTRPAGKSSKLYFRVKQTDATGKIKYSAIKWVDTKNELRDKFSLYPNPATNEVTFQFKSPQQNNIQVQLVNSTGQVVQTSKMNMGGSSQGYLRFNSKYAPGVYFLKVIDEKTKDHQVGRLIIK